MGKWAEPDLSDLENDLLNNSMKTISWQLINIIPKKLYSRNKEKLSDHFWENWQKVAKQPNLTFFEPFGPWKITFRVIQSNPSFGSSLYPPWEASCINREKVIKQFLRKLPPSKKRAKFDLSDLLKWPLGWFNQIHIFTMHWYHPKEATCQKRKKVIKQFWEIKHLIEKLTKDDDDDGRRRRTTDESALEKLRCLSAGGANKDY